MSGRGSRGQYYYGHDDRGDRGGRSRGGNRGRMGNRGGFGAPMLHRSSRNKYKGGYKGYGSHRSRLENTDSDVDMGGTSGNLSDNMRERFKPYGRNRKKRGTITSRGGVEYYMPPQRQTRDGEPSWFKIVIPQGKKFTKEFILKELTAKSELPFVPYNFQFDGSFAVFFINDYKCASSIKRLDKTIETPSGFKMSIILKTVEFPMLNVDDSFVEKLKVVLSRRYDASQKVLDLSRFHQDELFRAEGLFVPLFRVSVLSSVIKLIVDNVPEVQLMDFSDNKLSTLQPLEMLHHRCPNLKTLRFRNNKIRRMLELDCMKGMPIEELILDGNPVCDIFKDQNSYISAIRERFPKVVRLDGHVLPAPISFDLGTREVILPSKPSFFPSAPVKQIMVQFLEQYFSIFDSTDRNGLLDAYHDNAVLSLTATKLPSSRSDVKDFIKDSRNLLRLYNSEAKMEKLKIGRVNIVSFLNQLPHTRHDPTSFTVDVSLVESSMMIFAVFGAFRVVQRGGNLSGLKSFMRTFIIVPQGTGFSIINETVCITGATDEQMKAFPLPEDNPEKTPSSTQAPIMDKTRMITELCLQSRMNRDFAARCLEQNEWDFQKALNVFNELNVRGSIPPEAFQT
ncbi:nuclear RNA export factor 1-like isoform X2 [Ornithodoros turicata]|uniref:nuclear RNA export factor 1-like isoform X2 n=1 Tax=Ornithodoros turicata TaxID=34597 RepID=UPI00313A323D